MAVPAALRQVIGKTGFKNSLGTGNHSEARNKAQPYRLAAMAKIKAARQTIDASPSEGGRARRELDEEQLWQLASL